MRDYEVRDCGALASYRIEKPQIPENRKRNRHKIGEIGEKREQNRPEIENSYFLPIFLVFSGFRGFSIL